MYWRRFPISKIPLDNATEFEAWLKQRWEEKDALLDYFNRNGHFPADDAATAENTDGYIETKVRLVKWYEIGQIFIVLATLALVINVIIRFFDIILQSLRS